MGTLLHQTAHGLVASDTIMLANLVGGEGLAENTLYYVLAAGLTADDFAISLTDGGAAVSYTTDITEGSVVRNDTYEIVADGVMDAPTTPTTPTAPSVASSEAAGLVRLYVVLDAYTDAAVRIRSHEVQITNKYSGSDPDWTLATTHTLPLGTTDFSIPAMGSTAYAVRCRVQDVYGNFSAWNTAPVEVTTATGSDALNAALADIANDVPDGIITNTKIADDSITTAKIRANAITADLLATTLLLASLIKTADSGRRIEIDVDGIRLYDASDVLQVRVPTDGTAVFVNGEINASTLTAEDLTTINGTASLSGDAVMTLQNGISAPTSPPTLAASADYLSLTSTPGSLTSAGGVAYDSTGDSGAGSFWIACNPTVSPYYVAQEFAATATNGTVGRLIRSIAATGSTTTYTTTAGSTTHVSDTAQAYSGSTNSHIATNITMPSGRDNMQITKVAAYLAGYGASATCRNAVWSDVSGVGVVSRYSDVYTAAYATFNNGNSILYNKTLTSPLAASAGTIYAGFYHNDSGDGIQYDRDDGSSKNTYGGDGTDAAGDGWGLLTSSSKPNVYVTYTYDVDTRLETLANIGVATDGTHIYTLDTSGVVWKYLLSDLSYVTKSSVQTGITGTKTQAGLFYDATAGELLITTTTGTGTGVYPKIVRVVPSTLAVSTSYYTAATGPTFSGTTDTFRGGARLGADVGGGGSAAYWIATTSSVYAYTFATTVLTNVSDRDFGLSTTVGDGLTYDGTVFRGWDIASPTKVWKFSTFDWTTGGTTYWVGYGWSDGTSAYTECGPTSSVTVKRRQRLQVQNAALPGGTADAVRIYMYRGASDAAAGSRFYQSEDALTARYITAYATAVADPIANGFSAGNPAELKSDAAGWSLKGDGTVTFGTSVTPGGKPPTVQVKTSGTAQTYTPPTGVSYVVVEVVGGGGSGGSTEATGAGEHAAAGGGGGGGYARKLLTAAQLAGGAVSYTVGAGAAAGTAGNYNGNTGGTSSVSGAGFTTVQSTGGGPGLAGTATAAQENADGGSGGVGSGGDVNISGSDGGGAMIVNSEVTMGSGGGGASYLGGSTRGRITGGTGIAGNTYGGGGAGACNKTASTGAYAGGAGVAGVIVFTEYYGA